MCRLTFVVAAMAVSTACTPSQVRYEPSPSSASSSSAADATLFLVGDAGEVNPERADVLAHLSSQIQDAARTAARPVLVAFLGDNIYDQGLPTEPSREDLQKLNGQVAALGDLSAVSGVFLPGNHDWANGASVADGRAAVERQSVWIEQVRPGRDMRFLPDDGCPGPAGRELGASTYLVFIDTEWLLRRPEQGCGTADAFYERLAAELRAHADKRLLILAHHPLVSGGPHGGNIAPLEMGPFVYWIARKSGVSAQDLSSGRYAEMVRRIQDAIARSGTRPLAFAAGHDHTLQVVGMGGQGEPAFQLVSGAGSKSERSRWIEGMRYATDGFGYMRLDFAAEAVRLTVFARAVESGPVRALFSCALSEAPGACPEARREDSRP